MCECVIWAHIGPRGHIDVMHSDRSLAPTIDEYQLDPGTVCIIYQSESVYRHDTNKNTHMKRHRYTECWRVL